MTAAVAVRLFVQALAERAPQGVEPGRLILGGLGLALGHWDRPAGLGPGGQDSLACSDMSLQKVGVTGQLMALGAGKSL